MACLTQLGSVPATYAVVAGGCDWSLPHTVGLSNNDVTAVPSVALRFLRSLRAYVFSGITGLYLNRYSQA